MDSIKIFKYIVAINVVIVLIFIVFVLGVKLYQTKINEPKLILNNTENINYNSDISTNDLENKIEELVERNDEVYYDDIIKGGDIEKCNTIESEYEKAICINNIALNLAQETMDISYCERVDNKLVSRDECERQIILELLCKIERSITRRQLYVY